MPENSTYAQNYLQLFRSYQDEYLERLATLVNIDSGSGQVAGINQIMSHLKQWLSELNCSITTHPTEKYGDNIIARHTGNGKTRILLVGHVDTVYNPGDVSIQPFQIRDGVAYGPGVIDMKSGVLMALYVLRALIETHFDQYAELIMLFNNDEEIGSPGSKPLLRELAQEVDYALVLEPAGKPSSITHARKGSDRYKLEIKGFPAHSGAEPFKGRSAVVELAHKIVSIQSLHALFPGVTFNMTRLTSPEQLNIIPDHASCYVAVRGFNQASMDAAKHALENIAASSTIPGTHATLTHYPSRPPYEATPEILRMLDIAREEAGALGVQLNPEPKGGVSDANILVVAGVPTLDTLGPVGGGMHNLQNEHLHVDSFQQRGPLVTGLVQHLCLAHTV